MAAKSLSLPSSSNFISCIKRTVLPTSSQLPFIHTRNAARLSAREKQKLANSRSDDVRAMERQFTREWKVGDVYAPHDLSAAEARKWRKRYSPNTDAFDALNLNPLNMYKNFAVMSEYMTEMGRIRPASSTGLRRVNQRKISKAIRRAIALGLMPSVHRHPEILKQQHYESTLYGRPGALK